MHELRVSHMYGEYRSTAYFQGQGVDLLRQAGVRGFEVVQDPAIASMPAFTFSGLHRLFRQRGRRPAEMAGPQRVRRSPTTSPGSRAGTS